MLLYLTPTMPMSLYIPTTKLHDFHVLILFCFGIYPFSILLYPLAQLYDLVFTQYVIEVDGFVCIFPVFIYNCIDFMVNKHTSTSVLFQVAKWQDDGDLLCSIRPGRERYNWHSAGQTGPVVVADPVNNAFGFA